MEAEGAITSMMVRLSRQNSQLYPFWEALFGTYCWYSEGVTEIQEVTFDDSSSRWGGRSGDVTTGCGSFQAQA